MKWRSRFKRIMLSGVIVFGGYGVLKLILDHDLRTGLWSLAVGVAFVFGLLPVAWLTRSQIADESDKPEEYHLLPK
jgi:hypothetical protein